MRMGAPPVRPFPVVTNRHTLHAVALAHSSIARVSPFITLPRAGELSWTSGLKWGGRLVLALLEGGGEHRSACHRSVWRVWPVSERCASRDGA